MSMKRWTLIVALIGLLGLLLAACGRKEVAKSAAKAAPDETPQVRVGEVTESVADETLAVTGSINSHTEVNIASKVTGRVIRIGAQEGDRVAEGKVLVQLDARAAEADYQRAQGAYLSAKAQLGRALLTVGLVNTQTDTAVRTAKAQLSAAQARRSQADESYKIALTKSGDKGVDVTQAQDTWTNAQSRLTQMQQALLIERQKTTSDVDSADAAVQSATMEINEARNRLAQAKSSYDLTDSSTENAVVNAQETVNQAQYQVSILEEGSRTQEKGESHSQVTAATSALHTAEADYNRAKMLFEGGAISKAAWDNAQLELDTRREQLKQATLNESLVQEGPRAQEVQIGRVQLSQAKENLSQAKLNREHNLALRSQDLANAQEEVRRSEEALRSASAALATAKASRGQVLISEKDVAQAEQSVDTASQALKLAEAGVGQTEIAKKELEASEQAVTSAEQTLRNAEAGRVQPALTQQDIANLRGGLAQAEAAVLSAKVTLTDQTIIAPISGGIADREVEVGTIVTPGTKLYRLVADGYMHFEALVPEEKLHLVNPGDTVAVSVDARPGTKYDGRVLEIIPAADTRSRSFTVKVGVPNVTGKLQEGMFARGEIVVQRDKHTLKVPLGAIVRRDERNFVVRLDGDKAVPTEVSIGATKEGVVEIGDCQLVAGDRVVVDGAADITTETKVRILTDQPAAGDAAATPPPGEDKAKAK
jgi:RND family efflux transporter MFP subunit